MSFAISVDRPTRKDYQRRYAKEWARRHPEQRREAVRKHRTANREAIKERSRELYRQNPEHYRAKRRRYYWAHREKSNAAFRAWRRQNPELASQIDKTYRAANLAKCRETDRLYAGRFPEMIRAKSRRRRAVKRRVARERYSELEIFERDGWVCRLCNRPVDRSLTDRRSPQAPTIDHIVPLARGGADIRDNVQLAHQRCNSAKGARLWTTR